MSPLVTTFLILLSATLGLLYTWATKNINYWKKRKFPHLKSALLVGNYGDILLGKICLADLYRKFYRQMGNVKYFGILIGTYPALIVKDPELIMRILVKDFKHFYDRGFHISETDVLGNNLFFMRNPKWRHLRSKTVPVFSSAKLKSYFEIMDISSNDLIQYLNENCGGEEILASRKVMGNAFTDIMSKVICGIEVHSIKEPNEKHVSVQNAVFAPCFRSQVRNIVNFFSPYFAKKIDAFSPKINSYFNDLIFRTIELRKTKEIRRNDFLQLMSELLEESMLPAESGIIGKEDLVSNIFIMILAGFETSTSTSSITLHELAYNKGIQDKVRAEIKNVVRESGGKFKYEDMNKLIFLNQVISETLRLYPLVNMLFRQCMEDYNIPGTDLVIEKGVYVQLPTLALHTDPTFWSNPETYDPERFSEENASSVIPGSYLPFGDGPRICIGKRFALVQLKLLLAKILLHYEVSPCDKTKRHYPLALNSQLAVPEGDFWLKFTKLKE